VPEGPLVPLPLDVAKAGQHRPQEDQRGRDDGPAPGYVREWWQQLGDGEAARDQGQRGPAPGQEGALVREREPGVGLETGGLGARSRVRRAAGFGVRGRRRWLLLARLRVWADPRILLPLTSPDDSRAGDLTP
jgi:hypothetical protein